MKSQRDTKGGLVAHGADKEYQKLPQILYDSLAAAGHFLLLAESRKVCELNRSRQRPAAGRVVAAYV